MNNAPGVIAGTPFRRLRNYAAAVQAALLANAGQPLMAQIAIAALGGYSSPRKNYGAQHRSRHTVAQDKRAAARARNRQRAKR